MGLTPHGTQRMVVGYIRATGAHFMDNVHIQCFIGNGDAFDGDLNHSDHFGVHNQFGMIKGQPLFQNPTAKQDISAGKGGKCSTQGKFVTGLDVRNLNLWLC